MSTMTIPTTIKGLTQQDTRFTLRLPSDLLSWVQQEGGSRFIRDLLLERRARATESPLSAGPPCPTSFILRAQWDHLASEQRLLDFERELREDEERILDRQRTNLDKERELLADRRELLEEGWCALEEAQTELEEQKEVLLAALASLSLFPHRLL